MKKGLLFGLLLGLILLGLWLTFADRLKLPNLKTSSSTNPHNLERCDLKKKDNPLLEQEPQLVKNDQGDRLIGVFKGTIQSVSVASDYLSAKVQLASAKANQAATFNIIVRGIGVYNPKANKNLTIVDLKKGQIATLTFSCPVNQPDQFKITKVAVE